MWMCLWLGILIIGEQESDRRVLYSAMVFLEGSFFEKAVALAA